MAEARRRGGCALIAVLALIALGVGLFFGDAWARDRAENQITSELAARMGTDQVSTEVSGWPFLLAIPTKRLEQVDVQANQIPVEMDGRNGVVESLDATAVGVHNYSDVEQASIEQLDAVANFDWSQLDSLTGLPLRYAGPGRIALDQTLELLGNSVDVVVEADVELAATGELSLVNPAVEVSGITIPRQVVDAALDRIAPQLKLPVVAGLEYSGLEITEAGVAATMSGTNVPLRELG